MLSAYNKEQVMSIFRRRPVGIAVIVVMLIWLVVSPYFVLWQISNAAKSGDADSMSVLVDFPAVRESIKGSLIAAVTKNAAMASNSSSVGAGLGLMFAGPMINSTVDSMVTPQGISSAIKTGKMPDPTRPSGSQEAATSSGGSAVHYGTHYVSFDRFAVNHESSGQPAIEIRLCRVNVFGWKLCSVSINLPPTRNSGLL